MELQSLKNRFGIIGNSPALNLALQTAMQVAPTDLTVLINGESGVGKEIFSQIIHQLSVRKHNPFIAVNCGAIPEGTIDSELFGHEKGSFTGAHEARKGYFETVNGGTIFLDEVGELPIGTQARLLRVLESQEYIRVGSSKVMKTDVRVVAATNVNLLDKISSGKFREDLYYRLNTVPINVPSLRERKDDITTLFRKFCIDFGERYRRDPIQLDDAAKNSLMNYPFHGNVRELKNLAEQISVLSKNKIISAEELKTFLPEDRQKNLPALIRNTEHTSSSMNEREIFYTMLLDMKKDLNELRNIVFNGIPNGASFGNTEIHQAFAPVNSNLSNPVVIDNNNKVHEIQVEESLSLQEKEKEMIIKALKKHRGRRKDASHDLGISDRTLYRKIKEYNIAE